MASSPQDQLKKFESLLEASIDGENPSRRSQAEEALTARRLSNMAQTCQGFLMLIIHSKKDFVREFAAVLLRQHLEHTDHKLWVYPSLSEGARAQLKKTLLQGVTSIRQEKLRKLVCDCASELAVSLLPTDDWAEFMPWLVGLTKNPQLPLRINAYQIFAHLAVWVGEQFEDDYQPLFAVCKAGLSDPELAVCLEAHLLICSLLPTVHNEEELQMFVSLFPRMIQTTVSAVFGPQQKKGRFALEGLCEAIEANPAFLKPHLTQFCNSMLRIAVAASSTSIQTNTKQMAVETLLTLAEVKPGLARKVPQICDTIIPIMLHCMTLREDNDEWNLGPDHDPEENEVAWGEESLDRIANAMGGKAILPVLFKIIKNYATDQSNYARRMVALVSIAIVAEGCATELFPKIPDILKTFIPRGMSDPNPRVRACVPHLIGQLATDFKGVFTKTFGKICLNAIVQLMGDQHNPRLQSMAAAAIINWCDHCTLRDLKPFADLLCQRLLQLLQCGNALVEESCVTAVSSISDVLTLDFKKYYPSFSGPLKAIWKNRTSKQERTLRGKTLEAITLIGINVGREVFFNDALELTRMIISLQSTLADDDPLITYFQQSGARLAKVLGRDFVQFLPDVMPPVLKAAELEPEMEVHDADYRVEREGWQVVSIADKTIAINEAKLQDKTIGLNMIFCYATELEDAFINYVPQCAKIAIPLLRFYHKDEARESAVTIIPTLINCAKVYVQKHGGQGLQELHSLWKSAVLPFCDALSNEPDLSILLIMVESFSASINLAGPGSMGPEEITRINQLVKQLASDVFTRRSRRESLRNDPDYDEQDDRRLKKSNKKDDLMMIGIGEIVGKIFVHFGSKYLPLFQRDCTDLVKRLINPESPPIDQQTGLCIFADIVEWCKEGAAPVIKFVLPIFLKSALHTHPGCRQASVYGLGFAARNGGAAFAPALADTISALGKAVASPGSREDPYKTATDNAISAFAKVLLYHRSTIPAARLPQFVGSLMSWLPAHDDTLETPIIYDNVCALFEELPELVLGEGKQRFQHFLKVLIYITNTKLLNDSVNQRVIQTILKLKSHSEFNSVASSLKPEDQEKLRKIIASRSS